jgi:hypothetical protein
MSKFTISFIPPFALAMILILAIRATSESHGKHVPLGETYFAGILDRFASGVYNMNSVK